MKKLFAVVTLVSVLGIAQIHAGTGLVGGFGNFGLYSFYHDFSALNNALTASGYNPISGVDFGWGGGGGWIVNNFFFGGFGGGTMINQRSENPTTGNYIKTSFGMGGLEFGYAVAHTKVFTLIPTVGFIWGGSGITVYEGNPSNTTFNAAIENPGNQTEIGTETFSIELGVQSLFNFGGAGFIVKGGYLFTPVSEWSMTGSETLTAAPAIGSHSAYLSVGIMFGAIGTAEELSEMNMERRENRMDNMGMMGNRDGMECNSPTNAVTNGDAAQIHNH